MSDIGGLSSVLASIMLIIFGNFLYNSFINRLAQQVDEEPDKVIERLSYVNVFHLFDRVTTLE